MPHSDCYPVDPLDPSRPRFGGIRALPKLPTPAFGEALPTKLYEYLACGLAVLTTPVRRSAELVSTTGAGEVVASAADAASVLDRWAGDPSGLGRCRQAATAWADEHLRGPSPYDELARIVAGLAAGPDGAGGSAP